MNKRFSFLLLSFLLVATSGCTRSFYAPYFPVHPVVAASGVAAVANAVTSETPYSVNLVITPTQEHFNGSANHSRVGRNHFTLRSDKRTSCKGTFNEPEVEDDGTVKHGDGSFTCDDGRSGSFIVTGTETKGVGHGKMSNGYAFEFTYILP